MRSESDSQLPASVIPRLYSQSQMPSPFVFVGAAVKIVVVNRFRTIVIMRRLHLPNSGCSPNFSFSFNFNSSSAQVRPQNITMFVMLMNSQGSASEFDFGSTQRKTLENFYCLMRDLIDIVHICDMP